MAGPATSSVAQRAAAQYAQGRGQNNGGNRMEAANAPDNKKKGSLLDPIAKAISALGDGAGAGGKYAKQAIDALKM